MVGATNRLRIKAGRAVPVIVAVPPTVSIVQQTNNSVCEEAVKLIRKAGALMKSQKQSRQIGDYLADLRVQFKPKRDLIRLLNGRPQS